MADQTGHARGNIFGDMANWADNLEVRGSARKSLAWHVADPVASDVIRDGGIAPGKTLMGVFPGLQNMDTPEGMLNTLQTKLIPNMPESIPAGVVYNLLDRGTQGWSAKDKAEIRATLDPKLMDDGKLSRSEMLQVLSEIGNKTDSVEPAAAIRQQAAGILAQQHIDDPTGQLSTGLAKLAVSASVGIQRIENGPAPEPLRDNRDHDYRPTLGGPSPG